MGMLRRVIDAPRDALILLVRGYRFFLSPWLGSSCRFEPSCSAYSMQALGRHGAIAGSVLTVSRIARCHPWCVGGHDPVPDQPFPIFSRLLGHAAEQFDRSPLSREKNTP
jgi:putative membrane protein insertion efficiency factor